MARPGLRSSRKESNSGGVTPLSQAGRRKYNNENHKRRINSMLLCLILYKKGMMTINMIFCTLTISPTSLKIQPAAIFSNLLE
jgi:hypothetical protein